MSIIPVTQEMEIVRLMVGGQSEQNVETPPSQPTSQEWWVHACNTSYTGGET
jgi:hypothetical protein